MNAPSEKRATRPGTHVQPEGAQDRSWGLAGDPHGLAGGADPAGQPRQACGTGAGPVEHPYPLFGWVSLPGKPRAMGDPLVLVFGLALNARRVHGGRSPPARVGGPAQTRVTTRREVQEP
jgi:hypothetical protein